MTENFRNKVDIALNSAITTLDGLDSQTIRDLKPEGQVLFALAQAAVAIGHSLRKIAELKEDEADERNQRR